jgi:TolB-like protein/Tfp pilus assembly protein PilF
MTIPRRQLVRFGEFEIDSDACELRKSGSAVKLQPQPLKVLLLLAQRSGDVLTRAEIESAIWGDQVHVDFIGGLNFCIKQIRVALQDHAAHPRYVETLPRQGYRFVAKVERQQYRTRSDERIMLAVLPFGNLTGQEDQEYFTDGMTEELIAQLSRLHPKRLGIIAFTSARQYRNTSKSIEQIGSELGVSYILEGSVRRAGNRVRIAAQLVEVSDQCDLWAEAYNRTLDDVITIQTDVAQSVAQSLMLELLPDHRAELVRASTVDPAAYEAYLKGRFYWNKRTRDGFLKALKHFQIVIDRAPNYAPGYVGIADVYKLAALYGVLPPKEAFDQSRTAITKALELDNRLAAAHTSLAYGKVLYEWDFSGAEKSFKHALDLDPNHVPGHYWYALLLVAMRRFDEAMGEIGLAMELDPLSLVVRCNKGQVLYFARRYDEAASQLRDAIEMDGEFPLARYLLGRVYLQTREYAAAAAQFENARKATNGHSAATAGLVVALANLGHRNEGKKLLQELERLANTTEGIRYYLAIAWLGFGDMDRALRNLQKACDEYSVSVSNMDVDPALDSLRKAPAFAKLLKRVGLKSPAKGR